MSHDERNFKHGAASRRRGVTPEYRVWMSMIQRCTNPARRAYENYGGRGIRVCDAWRKSYVAFVCDVGLRPSPAHLLDRINNNGHYEPGNVRWSTRRDQNRNRRNVRLYTWRGETKCMAEWSQVSGVTYFRLRGRLDRGWSIEDALTTPADAPSRRWNHGA